MTDARILRTRKALHTAVTDLATNKAISEATVSELADTAGINRVTFYKHYTTPADALAAALRAELEQGFDSTNIQLSDGDPFAECITAVLDHIESRRTLYEIAFKDEIDGTVSMMLSQYLNEVAETYLTKRRKRKPAIPDIDVDVASAFFASGATGAIRVWLLEGDMSRERLYENLPYLLPSWFYADDAAN